jgi:hypothetical protein
MIISWDIGINNLAYCILDDNANIHSWKVIDTLAGKRNESSCVEIMKRTGKVCGKSASLKSRANPNDTYCRMHAKNKDKGSIYDISKCCMCKSKGKYRVGDLIYCKKHQAKLPKSPENTEKLADNMSIFDKHVNLIRVLDSLGEEIHAVDKVVIENQPVYKNPIMKSIQMVLYSYYLLRDVMATDGKVKDIILMNATNKLKVYDGPVIECEIKDKHKRNKVLGKQYCDYMMEKNVETDEWKAYYKSHKKQDDLADCYLQALYYHGSQS